MSRPLKELGVLALEEYLHNTTHLKVQAGYQACDNGRLIIEILWPVPHRYIFVEMDKQTVGFMEFLDEIVDDYHELLNARLFGDKYGTYTRKHLERLRHWGFAKSGYGYVAGGRPKGSQSRKSTVTEA